jgi:hypothetical protein
LATSASARAPSAGLLASAIHPQLRRLGQRRPTAQAGYYAAGAVWVVVVAAQKGSGVPRGPTSPLVRRATADAPAPVASLGSSSFENPHHDPIGPPKLAAC